jgi:hypothetical protein
MRHQHATEQKLDAVATELDELRSTSRKNHKSLVKRMNENRRTLRFTMCFPFAFIYVFSKYIKAISLLSSC